MQPTLTNFEMPKGKESISLTYPWGDTLLVQRTGGDYRDLAAQSTRFVWTLTAADGNKIGSGDFTAIGGLSGSFQSCYYPAIRGVENRMTRTVYITDRASDKHTSAYPVLVTQRLSHLVAVKDRLYGGIWIWLEDPIALPAGIEVEQGATLQRLPVGSNLYADAVSRVQLPTLQPLSVPN